MEVSARVKRLTNEDDSRVARDIRAIGHDKGTNLQMIILERPLDEPVEINNNQNEKTSTLYTLKDSGNNIMTIIVTVLVVLLVVLVVVGGFLYKRSRGESGPVPSPNGGTAI